MLRTYMATVVGLEPGVLMHSTAGMAGMSGREAQRRELAKLAKVTAGKRTPPQNHRMAQIETDFSIYWDHNERPYLPPATFRAAIEKAARMTKDGPRVRRGVRILATTFDSPVIDGRDRPEIIEAAMFSTVVRVGRQSVIRTRGLFYPWQATITIAADDAANQDDLAEWLTRAGNYIGVGDWRPDCSGVYGRFIVDDIGLV